MKYTRFYQNFCFTQSYGNDILSIFEAKKNYNKFIEEINNEILMCLYNIGLSQFKKDYILSKVYITRIIDNLLMINENEEINKFKLFFEDIIYNKCIIDYYILNKYCIENDIVNTIFDVI